MAVYLFGVLARKKQSQRFQARYQVDQAHQKVDQAHHQVDDKRHY